MRSAGRFFLAGGAGGFFPAGRGQPIRSGGRVEFQDLREKVAYGSIQEKILHM